MATEQFLRTLCTAQHPLKTSRGKRCGCGVPCRSSLPSTETRAHLRGFWQAECTRRLKWRVMSQDGLKRYTFLTSIYGESNFRFLDQTESNPITIVDFENDCHVAITKEARLRTIHGRAVTFFKGSVELEKYLATSYKSTLSQRSLL